MGEISLPFVLKTQTTHPGEVPELYCKAEGSGIFFAKKGSMVADVGNFKYSKRLLGTNDGNILGQVLNHVARKITGENLEIMEVQGSGVVYLADKESHVTIIELEPNGQFESVSVESEDLLAFTETCKYGVTPVLVGALSQKGFFTSKLSYNGPGAQVAIKTKGNPLMLQAPCRVDPDAVVAWTGKAPKPVVDVNWKTFIGQTSGETYIFEFTEPGQIVIVQPYEREGGLSLSIDNDESKNYDQHLMQSSPQGGLFGNNGQPGQSTGQSQQGGIGGIFSNIFNR